MTPVIQQCHRAIKPKLLDQVRQRIRTKHYSLRTEQAYVHWIKRFIFFHNKQHPAEMGEPEISAFISNLAVSGDVASSTQNQALSAILFLYKEVLNQEVGKLDKLVWAKKAKRLPVVFTREETKRIIGYFDGTKWLMVNILYGAGLRLRECLQLRVKDIDFSYNQITVRAAKGNKDRITVLPEVVKEPLRKHLLKANKMHGTDLRNGFGMVYLPDGLARKYPNAAVE